GRGAAARRREPVRAAEHGEPRGPRRPGDQHALVVTAGAGPLRPAASRRRRLGPAAARSDPAAAAVVGPAAVGPGGAAGGLGPARRRPGAVLGPALRRARRSVVGGAGRAVRTCPAAAVLG